MSDAQRCLVIGLDGMPVELLERLGRNGVMPFCGALAATSTLHELMAPVPEISSTSWASFLTGVNPAGHGVFGFVDLDPAIYAVRFPTIADSPAPALWHRAAWRGARSAMLNVPGTYPAHALEGVMVSGFVAHDLERAVRPAHLAPQLRHLGYPLDVDVTGTTADPHGFALRVLDAVAARERGFLHLLTSQPWDLAVAVITETDRLQHFLWCAIDDAGHPVHDAVIDVYRRVDQAVERLAMVAGDEAGLMLVSDHGFAAVHTQVHVNAWLRQAGWLAPAGPGGPASLDGSSRAFALDPARFHVHRRARFSRGAVTESEADALCEDLRAQLLSLRVLASGAVCSPSGHDGVPLFSDVHRRDDVYRGDLLEAAPDLVATPAPGMQLRGTWDPPALLADDVFTGTHSRGGGVFWARGCTAPRRTLDMVDAAATVAHCAGLSVDGMDGGVALDLQAAAPVGAHHPARRTAWSSRVSPQT